MKKTEKRLQERTGEQGLSTVEYVVILVLIVVIAVIAWQRFGRAVSDQVGGSTNQVNGL